MQMLLKLIKFGIQFPVGENNTVWVGPKIENYYMHGTTPSIYKPVTKQLLLVVMVLLMVQVQILVLVGLTKLIMDLLLVQTLFLKNLKSVIHGTATGLLTNDF